MQKETENYSDDLDEGEYIQGIVVMCNIEYLSREMCINGITLLDTTLCTDEVKKDWREPFFYPKSCGGKYISQLQVPLVYDREGHHL